MESARRDNLPLGLAIILLLAGPWFAYMSWRFPGYAADFFYRHHVLRATSSTFGRSANLMLLPGVVMGGFLPWTVFLVGAIAIAIRQRHNPAWRAGRPGLALAYWWAIIGVVPFMIFHTKLPVYLMPAFPACASGGGDYWPTCCTARRGEMTWLMGLTLAVMGLTLVGLAVTNRYTFDRRLAHTRPPAARVRRAGRARHLASKAARLRAVLLAAAAMTVLLTIDATWVEGPGLAEESSSRRFAEPIRSTRPR